MNRFALLTAAVIALAGCATHPVSSSEAVPVPQDRVFAFHSPGTAPSGTLVIARDAGYMAGGCPMALYIDGTLAAHLRAGEATALIVPTGNRIISAGPAGKGMCMWGNEEAYRRETSHVVGDGT